MQCGICCARPGRFQSEGASALPLSPPKKQLPSVHSAYLLKGAQGVPATSVAQEQLSGSLRVALLPALLL